MQTLDSIYKYIKSEPSSVTFSTLFRRHRMKVPLVGDYIVLVYIAGICGEKGKKLTKSQVRQALKYSADYQNDKETYWYNDILENNAKGYEKQRNL